MMQGEYDDVVSNKGAIKWFNKTRKVSNIDKSRKMFAKAAHELH